MLHKLEMPAYRAQLEAILDFQQQLLAFACTVPPLPLDSPTLKSEFGALKGNWLSERCWKGSKTYTFCTQLINLMTHIAQNPSEGPAIVNAFKHDRNFYLHLTDANFEFHYTGLSKKAKEYIQPLMVSFYEKLLRRTGFPDYIHLCNKEIFNYKMLLRGFYDANPELLVCPGCDGPPPYISQRTWDIETDDTGDYQNEAEVDHFFPKSLYPFLSIHFINLVPLCTICNTKAKKGQDPLQKCTGRGVLQYTFIPFNRPAAVQCIDVTLSKRASASPKVVIKSKPGLASPEQVDNLNQTFQLTTRWEHHLKSWIEDSMIRVGRASARKKRSRQAVESAIKEALEDISKAHEEEFGSMTYLLVQKGYANYALNNQQEIELLIEQALDNSTPRKRK